MKEKNLNKTKNAEEIESEIVKIIQKKIENKEISIAELEKMILEEIEKENYLSEDWQKHHAKERIKEILRPKKKPSGFKKTLTLLITLIPALFLYSITRIILREEGIILGGLGGVFLLSIYWFPIYFLVRKKIK